MVLKNRWGLLEVCVRVSEYGSPSPSPSPSLCVLCVFKNHSGSCLGKEWTHTHKHTHMHTHREVGREGERGGVSGALFFSYQALSKRLV
jgi:hypothetical protein